MAEQLEVRTNGPRGPKGWTPVFLPLTDGARKLVRITSWQGGAGDMPATGYIGASGLTDDIAQATDFAGRSVASLSAIADSTDILVTYADGGTQVVASYFAPFIAAAADVTENTLAVSQMLSMVESKRSEVAGNTQIVNDAKVEMLAAYGSTQALTNAVSGAQAAKTGAETALGAMQDGIPKGPWNAATNSPALMATPPVHNPPTVIFPDGSYYEVQTPGNLSFATVNFASGTPVYKGDKLKKLGSQWFLVPFGVGDGTVTRSKLETYLQNLLGQLPDDSPYLAVWIDAVNRLLMAVRKDGFIEGRFVINAISMMANAVHTASIQNGAVTHEKLGQLVKDLLGETFDATHSEYLYLRLDPQNRILLGIKKDGSIVGKFDFSGVTVTEAMLSDPLRNKVNSTQLAPALSRLIQPNSYDVDIEDDGLWRGVEIDIPVKTEATGYGFAQFPFAKTKVLKGLNNTGTALLFRKSNNLPIRGRKYRGTFDPAVSGVVGTNLRGGYGDSYNNNYPAFPSGSTGDCWVLDCGNTTATKTANGLTFKNGDLLVKTAGGYAIQPGPGNGTFSEGDFWNVSAAGTFAGMGLSVTGRLLYLGRMPLGGPAYARYITEKAGEYYLMGECDPAGFTPVTPRNGDLYTFSAAGTAQGVTGAVGDTLLYNDGWGLSAGMAVTVANGLAFSFPCEKASEWEVRRADKSTTVVSVAAKGYRTTVIRRVLDFLLLLSDSMFGVSGVGSKILALSGRTGTVLSYGGGTSNDVLAMLRYHIRNGDPYAGRVHVLWHGQNNQTDTVQIKGAAYQMASLLGAYEKRFVFWSVLGQRAATWNGTRIVVAQHEDAKAGTNHIAEIERFYELAFPRQFFNVRKALLETAVGRTSPDPQFPGMSEEQVAATYGIVPFSYFFDFSDKPFTAANLTFLGYHSAAGLPTGGVDKNYYIRTGNGTVGQLIVNVAGTWTEYSHDVTHLRPAGADAAAGKFSDLLNLLNI